MSWIVVAIGLLMLAFGAWASALHLALQEPSRSELEDLLQSRRPGKGAATASWLFDRRPELSTEVALIRTALRVGVTVSAFIVAVEADPDPSELVAAPACRSCSSGS